jgi:hypothetical protein
MCADVDPAGPTIMPVTGQNRTLVLMPNPAADSQVATPYKHIVSDSPNRRGASRVAAGYAWCC